MSHALKNKTNKNNLTQDNLHWRPTATIDSLRQRAALIKLIRDFFATRSILEVETPLLCHTTVTDPFIESISAIYGRRTYYLQTSPEYAMKRLLAAGFPAIYQICKAFRHGEQGHLHNPEFTLLEWYRLGFDHHALMDEVDELLQFVLKTPKAKKFSYAEIFNNHLEINPHEASLHELQKLAFENELHVNNEATIHDRDTWLNLLLTHCIEPKLGDNSPCFIYDFPQSQAALARIEYAYDRDSQVKVASRFEVYFRGIELANGFHELQDADEQRLRFEKNLIKRKQLGLKPIALDQYFLTALNHGLPACAGVALGVDRLVMLATKSSSIADVLSLDFARA